MSLCAQLDTPTSKESKVRQCSTRGIEHIPTEDNRLELTSLLKTWPVFSSFELVLLQLSLPPLWLSRRTQVPAFRACLILQEIFLCRGTSSLCFFSQCVHCWWGYSPQAIMCIWPKTIPEVMVPFFLGVLGKKFSWGRLAQERLLLEPPEILGYACAELLGRDTDE